MKSTKYIVTWAQNATPAHLPFLASLKTWAKATGGQILVVAGRYKNPTSQWTDQNSDHEWWAPELVPYLVNRRVALDSTLKLYGEVKIQPTATSPLTGFEVFVGQNSGIFGHPRRSMKCIATGSWTPRQVWTTGAITPPNYTKTKTGQKAREHHVLGALVVETDGQGWRIRNVTGNKRTGVFADLDKTYGPDGVTKTPGALSVTLGDWHSGTVEPAQYQAAERLVKLVKPSDLFLHDFLDFRTRNHHDTTVAKRYPKRADRVEAEVAHAVYELNELAKWAPYVHVIRSNHDLAFERWLEEARPMDNDLENLEYWHAMNALRLQYWDKHQAWPNMFRMEAENLGVASNVHFAELDNPVALGGILNGFHGHIGVAGSRGSIAQYDKLGGRFTIGHSHTPGIQGGVFSVGVTGRIRQGYNRLPSAAAHAHVVQHHDSKRQLIFVDDKGRF